MRTVNGGDTATETANMKKELTFEQFDSLEESEFTEKISNEYRRYNDGEESLEQWFHGHIEWINREWQSFQQIGR